MMEKMIRKSRRGVALVLCFSFLAITACKRAVKKSAAVEFSSVNSEIQTGTNNEDADLETLSNTLYAKRLDSLTGLDDPELLRMVEDNIYSELEVQLASDDYIIEDISAVYISKEYLETLEYNSRSNIFFGHTLAELDEMFQGTRYIFSLDGHGNTIVTEYVEYDEEVDKTFNQILRNVAIGTGVILVCVTISTVTGGAASAIFLASAKTATSMAFSSALLGGVSKGVITGIQTGDYDQAMKAGALAASEGFMWGAISGAVIGGASKAYELKNTAGIVKNNMSYQTRPTHQQSEMDAYNYYKGYLKQPSYLNGQEVPYGTPGSTRPDLVRNVFGHKEAIEVKNYDLSNPQNINNVITELKRQTAQRAKDLPEGFKQRICLDCRGQNLDGSAIKMIKNKITEEIPNIPIDFLP